MDSESTNLDPVQRDFLRHPMRRRIVELLAKRPGLNKSQVAAELGIHLNLARFHLRRLEAVELVLLRQSPRQREVVCFLPRDAHLWDEPRTRLLFGRSAIARVAGRIARFPGATAADVAGATGLSDGAVHHHLKTLRVHGLITRFRLESEYRHYPADELKRWAASSSR